ncbi:PEP-CTERM sorting domain-containing protein [Pelobacter sp. M08fum]|uniref:PEP-CTERM sorting domain-containing protein n=2 Tax=Pelovirga terrestris TaxID=2771352 RepID=A0A8J6UR47_9BACT|nr:PEP-CTERM sorting domain-containing protein [Pelovirga terrestris]
MEEKMKKLVPKMSAFLMMATFGMFLFATIVSAAPIVGEIQFEGSSQLTDGAYNPAQTFASAEGLKFDDVTVKFSIGDFAGNNSATATYEDFIFDSFAGPITPLWSVGKFSFNLETLEIVTHTTDFLGLKGLGMLSADGFDDTKGAWILSLQTVSGLTGITFSAASAAPVAVPEPGTLLLLGSGMAGLALARRRSAGK